MIATYNVRTLTANGRHGYYRDQFVLAKIQQLACDLVGMQKATRHRETFFFNTAGYRVLPVAGSKKNRKPGINML